MRDETVARSYAETLVEVAERHGGVELFGDGLDLVARLLDENHSFKVFLQTPRISPDQKKEVVRKVFADALPGALINFLLVTIDKRRQRLIGEISHEFNALVDERLDRVRVEVTLARKMDEASLSELQERLTKLLGREAIPSVRVKPGILGGIVVRAGDTIYDGSLRRRLDGLRHRMLTTDLPKVGEA